MNNVNDIRAFGLSRYAATSVTEVSNVDVDFTEAGLMTFGCLESEDPENEDLRPRKRRPRKLRPPTKVGK